MEIHRETQFEQLLQSDDIATHVLKAACLHGIPDNADLRAEAWRTLLGVVDLTADGHSNDYAARKASKARKRKQYHDLATELLGVQSSSANSIKTPQDSWLDDIDKDVRRTQTSYAFFSQVAAQTPERRLPRSLFQRLNRIHPHRQEEIQERYDISPSRKGKEKAMSQDVEQDRHFEILIRMLYVFALLNPVHYVQGMSELIAPLYYVFSQSSEKEEAEADTFWAFSFLMGEIGDFYVQDSDGSFGESQHADVTTVGVAGLGAALRQFAKELHWIDSELAYNLHTQKEIQPTFYALRWITCLMAMDFRIPDLIVVWDSLFAMFADSTKQAARAISAAESEARGFLLDLCVAMVLVKRHELLSSSFSACLFILQNYVCEDVHTVLTLAFSIRERRITSSLTGIEISSFSSVPNSPLPDAGDFSSTTSPSVSLQNARQALSMAANNVSSAPTAKALRQRFFKQRDGDFPDDASDVSSVTAPGAMESNFGSPARSTATSPATTVPSSASSLLNKYAKSFASSDAAAQLNKMTTNSYITALQWKDSAPSTFTKWKSDVSTKVSGAAGAAKTVVRPPSPQHDPPFTPPTANTGRWLSPEGTGSPGGIIGDRRGSGPKPLLLSSAARRASATLQQDIQPASPHHHSNFTSRRTSYSGPSSNSVGLGLPRSLEIPIHRSRTPSPTAQTRSDPHARAASTSQLGSYKIGNGRNGHAEQIGAGSLVGTGQSPAYKLQQILANIEEKELPVVESEIPVGRLSISGSHALDESSLPRPPQRPRRSIDQPQFSLLREKAASNDVEILSDGLSFGDHTAEDFRSTPVSAMSRFFQDTELSQSSSMGLETPPQSPKQSQAPLNFSSTDDIPLSPSRVGAGLARSFNRQPRTTSLANIDTETDGSMSPTHMRSPTSSIDVINGDLTASQRPSRRRLASSRRLLHRDSVDSVSTTSGDVNAQADL